MPSLLCTLGTSWAVVPEAFLLGNGDAVYQSVTIVTTNSEKTRESMAKVHAWFREYHPDTTIRALVIEGLSDLASSMDHSRFEEGLYRAYFAMLGEECGIHVCLAGGFKTMSAAAHEAAGLLGCEKLFHIMAPVGIKTDSNEDLLAAIAREDIRIIGLGSRAGWPTILELASKSETLPPLGEPFLVEDYALCNAIHHRLEAANRLSASEKDLATLPFPQIARWAPGERDWLNHPLDSAADEAWLLALPKIELHCHLGGFATHGGLLDQVRIAACDPAKLPAIEALSVPAGWPATVLSHEPNQRLSAYMKMGDNNGSKLLRDPGCLAEHCRLLYQHLFSQNIVYAEIRCSPANYASEGRSPWTVLSEIKSTFDASMTDQPGCHVNLIIIATRKDQGDFRTDIARHLSLAVTAAEHWVNDPGCRVVGVDLAGYEDTSTRAHYFREDFSAAHRVGLGITIHAGENDDAEGIWSAILDINTRRLGHALHLADSPTLLKTVADRRIGIEMCPYANLQIKGFPLDSGSEGILPISLPNYPLLDYLQAGIPVTVNTDNIGISDASLTENFLLLPRLCPGITRLHILKLLRNAIDQAFLTGPEKDHLLALPIPHHRHA